ncbi:MAG TPA: lipopolysaccharide biosynthesis protein [Gemmatimonadaceae bacterium]|nr:lipopolysaccharide biosynthesis protein [Gemmatimonadaceae bacterium]
MSGADPAALLAPPEADEATVTTSTPAGSAAHNEAIATGVMWNGALRWLSQVLSWSATIVIARRLSPGDYGMAGTATVLVGLLALVTEGGIGRAVVMRRDRDDVIVRQAHGAGITAGFGMALVMLLAAYPISRFYDEPRVMPLIAALSIALVFSGFNAIPLAVLQQRLEYRRLAAVEFVKAIVQAATVLAGALAGLRYWSLALGLIAGYVASVLMARRYITVQADRPTRAVLGPTVSYARELVVGSFAWYLYSNADFAVVGRVAGLTALGYYQFAWNVAQLPGEKLANVLQSVVGPFFGAIGDDRKMLKHYFLVLSELLVSIMLPVLCGFALVSSIAVPMIFGAKWLPSVPLMQVLVLCSAVGSVSLLSQHVLSATGQAAVNTRLNLGALLVLPLGFYLAARFYGPFAVAMVWLVAQPVLMGVPLARLKHTVGLSTTTYLLSLRAPVISSLVMSVAVLALARSMVNVVPIVQLLALSCLGAVVYIGVFMAFFRDRVDAIVMLWKSRA